MAEGINLALLPALDVVEQVNYEDLVAKASEKAGLTNLSPSDPGYRVVLAGAYREMMVRQDANEQAKGLVLAHAKGAELDHIGATYYQKPDGSPLTRLSGESDEDFKARLQQSPEGLSVAGPDGAYIVHAKSAHPNVKDVSVDSPAPVEVVLTILSSIGDGTASQSILDAVEAYLKPFRPLTDKLSVQAATILKFEVTAKLYIKEGPDPELVRSSAEERLKTYLSKCHKLSGRVVRSGLDAALTLEGVEEVRLSDWNDLICNKQQAPFCTGVSVKIGGYV